ncbi:MAG: ribosomal protein L11 methyltransferase [Deltaproteobacteria bacterium RBG_19FT_COMBO_46_12]|nr:MAG: ribosomal protein L11 methyltransferase [Deltaproteobacteria bacterium RBG_19FT_COMBO_46_12]
MKEFNRSRIEPVKRWLVVEISIPKGFGEAVSNFLIEQGAAGMEELEGGSGWERLKAYFPQDGKEKRVIYAFHRYLKSLQRDTPEISRSRIKTASIPEQDWGENWKRFFKPVQVTSRFWVKPPWSQVRLKRGQISIDITPGMAFGTGTHASTRLCIQALGERIKKKGLSILDVGTGSGILSIVAAKLGAKEVRGIDIDGAAVENATENVEKNHVSGLVRIKKGHIGDLQKKFDLIVANIDFKSLKRMERPLLNHLKDQGILILSGILKGQEEGLCERYLETGLLRYIKDTQEGEWVCLTFRKV